MWRILVSFLLVAVAVGQQSGYTDPLNIAGGYLPPSPEPAYHRAKSVRCDDPKTIYETESRKVPQVVKSTVIVKVPQIIKSTNVIKKVVPSVKVVRRVKEVPSPVVKINRVTKVVSKIIRSIVSVPGKVIVKTDTKFQDQIKVKTNTHIATDIKSVYSTGYRDVTNVKRVVQSITVPVPEVVYVSKIVLVPGRTITATNIKYVQVTDVKKYQPPARTEIKKEIKMSTAIKYREVPGPLITKDVIKMSTVYVGSTRISEVPQVSTRIIPVDKKIVRTVVKTVLVTAPVTTYVTRYETVPILIPVTREQVHTVPLQVIKTEYVVKSVRGPDVVRSITVTDKQYKTVRDPDNTVIRYRNVERVTTVTSSSTIIKPVRVTQVVEKTEPCSRTGGYKYNQPPNPLVF